MTLIIKIKHLYNGVQYMGKSNYVKKLEKENALYKRMWKKDVENLFIVTGCFLNILSLDNVEDIKEEVFNTVNKIKNNF